MIQYVRREWPAWGRLYQLLGGTDDANWRQAGMRRVRGKLHGYTMNLDLANWSERLSWCLARYHDLALQVLLQRVLRTGDCFVDVGANIGMLSALAHRLVGESGTVLSFEPNPRLASRLQTLKGDNQLEHMQVRSVALGDAPGVLQLREFAGHSGWGTLATRGPEGAAVTHTVDVPVVVGDDLLAAVPASQPIVMKIDVEGYEVPVLRGLQATLRRGALLIVEVGEAHQTRAGFSGAELRRALTDHGYRGFVLDYRRHLGPWRTARPRPLAADEPHEVDALFVPPAGFGAERVTDWFRG